MSNESGGGGGGTGEATDADGHWLDATLDATEDLVEVARRRQSMRGVSGLREAVAEAVSRRWLGLFVVRESDEHTLFLFDGQREQTYTAHRHIPAVDAVRRAGLAPMAGSSFIVEEVEVLDDGTEVRRQVVVPVKVEVAGDGGRTKAYVFEYGGYWHLWSQASAAKSDDMGRNEWTTIFLRVILRIRPLVVFVSNLSRLIRDHSHGAQLSASMKGNVNKIQVGSEFALDFEHEPDAAYMRLWMMGWCAALERKWILQRLAAGRVAAARNGKWPFGADSVPFGYELDQKSEQLRVDESKRDLVRSMMLIIADGAMSTKAKAAALDELGIRGSHRDLRTGRTKAFSAKSNRASAIRTFLTWAPVWCVGEYVVRLDCHFDGVEEIAGVPIARREDETSGELQIHITVDLPEGGWAEPTVLGAFAECAIEMSVAAIEKGTEAPRELAPAVAARCRSPRLLSRVLTAGKVGSSTAETTAMRDRSREREMLQAFSGKRWVDGNHLYESQSAPLHTAFTIYRWPLSVLPAGVDPLTGKQL